MKKLLTTIAFGAMTLTGTSILAQTPEDGNGSGYTRPPAPELQESPAAGPGTGMRGRRGDPAQRIQRRLERMSEYLELSDPQKTQIKTIIEEQHAKRVAMRGETHDRISAVLNEQQRIKFEQMRAKRGKGRPGGWGRRGGGPGYGDGTVN